MLEILAIWALASKIGSIVKEKGHKTAGYIVLAIALWVGGELVGAVVGTVVSALLEASQCLVYLFALAGAACGGGIAYLIATNLPQRQPLPVPAGARVPVAAVLTEPQTAPGIEEAEEPGRAAEIEQAARALEQSAGDDPP
jgi:hypothetical protein